ncbi:hypothetical protein DHD08_02820 [Arenibacter sp. H213]|uniref:Uncharacterized protein n=1 Tax=Arenibacter antarcticus TaxID=2040469 RepID=A0ABW5VE55_9FLAO|nr:hypothetical protein [Arenibacter sp. H213]MCM4166608.1 hypothetical protein [Arenibacter sp. H213]
MKNELLHPEKQILGVDDSNKIKVLNFGTMHLSGSGDAFSSTTNINDPMVAIQIQKVINM